MTGNRNQRRKAPEAVRIAGVWATNLREGLEKWANGEEFQCYEYDEEPKPKIGVSRLAIANTDMLGWMASIGPAEDALYSDRERAASRRGGWDVYKRFDKSKAEAIRAEACEFLQEFLFGDHIPTPARARKIAGMVGEAHQLDANMLDRLGYEEITEADQDALRKKYYWLDGGGGGR